MSLVAELRRNLDAMSAELKRNPSADVRTWLEHMVSLAELIHHDSNVAKRTSERNTERNTVTLLRRNMLRSDVRPGPACHGLGVESVDNSSADKETG